MCQFGEMHFWHDPCSISRIHYWWMRGACGSSQDPSHLALASSNHFDRAPQLSGSCQFLPQVSVGILSYHLALGLSDQGKSESKILLVWISTKGIHRVETSSLLCTSAHSTRLATTIWDQYRCLWLCYWGSPYSTGASSGISQWDTFRLSAEVSHLWKRDVFHFAGLPTMEALILEKETVIHTDHRPL